MQTAEAERFTKWQKITLALTAVSAILILVVSVLVVVQLDMTNATPGFVEFIVLAALVVGMFRKLNLAYLGVLVAKLAFVALAAGAFIVRPPAIVQLGWFGGALVVNILLGIGIIVSAAQTFREEDSSEDEGD